MLVCSWITGQVYSWSKTKEKLVAGVNAMLTIAVKLVAKEKKR
jgi:hypothetical protein